MKKLSLLALSLVLVLSFAGCSTDSGKKFDDMTAYEHYVAVNEKTGELKSLEMDYTAKANMGIADLGLTMDMDMSGKVQQVIHSETDQDMAFDMTIAMMGESMTMKMVYIDGIMYQDDGTSKTKYALDVAEVSEQAGMAGGLNAVEFFEDSVLESSMEDVENGKKLTFKLDPTKMNDLMGGIVDPILDSFDEEGMEMDLKIGNLSYELVIDREHNLKGMRLVMDMEIGMTVTGMGALTMTCDMDMSYNVVSVNSVSEIVLPDDAESYTLIDSANV